MRRGKTFLCAKKRGAAYGIRLIIAYVFNVADLILTRYFISKGFNELNPFARFLIDHKLDGTFKVVIIGLALLYFWQERETRAANIASWIAFGIYTFIALWWAVQIIVYIKYK